MVFKPSDSAAYLCSEEPRKLECFYFGKSFWESQVLGVRERKTKIDELFFEKVANLMVETIQQTIWDFDHRQMLLDEVKKKRETLKKKAQFAAYLARVYFDAELFVVAESEKLRIVRELGSKVPGNRCLHPAPLFSSFEVRQGSRSEQLPLWQATLDRVEAIVRPERLDRMKDALAEAGFVGLNEVQVTGRGQQKGITIQGPLRRTIHGGHGAQGEAGGCGQGWGYPASGGPDNCQHAHRQYWRRQDLRFAGVQCLPGSYRRTGGISFLRNSYRRDGRSFANSSISPSRLSLSSCLREC